MENYKEIIDRNIKEFDEKFEEYGLFGDWGYGDGTFNREAEVKQWHTQSLISFLEEENKRLRGENKWTQSDLKSPFGHSEDKGYNQAKQEEIDHNLQVITYLKEL